MVIKEDQQVWSTNFFDKKTGSRASMNEELAQELHKPVIKKIQKEESLCNICAIDLVKMGSSSLKGKTYKN